MRRGLVLGGGGVLGAAWTVGALSALENLLGEDLRSAELIVGTSAGSVLGSLLAAGVSVGDLRRQQLGEPITDGLLAGHAWDAESATGGSAPPRPRPGVGSTKLLVRGVVRPRRYPPAAVLSALLPEGRGSLSAVGDLVRSVAGDGWARRAGLWVVTMDYETGRRVAFGRDSQPDVPLADAVMASCAIPGWYQPVRIGAHRYVDGGTCSPTSVDLLAGRGLDEVWVLAPAISFAMDRPQSIPVRLERRWRSRMTRRCLREVAKVHATGTEVTVLGPGPQDLEAFGANVMDSTRRGIVLETSLRTSAEALAGPRPLSG
ncbi:MAG: patatin-like phospholipase family protein [Angustibacter sp.]